MKFNKSFYFFLSLIFVSFVVVGFGQSGTLKGKVTDSLEAVPSVNIILLDTEIGGVTGLNGEYIIRNIPIGEYEVKVSAIGYITEYFDVNIETGRTAHLDIRLRSTTVQMREIEIVGNKNQDYSDTRTSFIDLNPRSAKILPGAAEDVFRTLQSLPGVLAPNDFSSQLIVRGSGPDQNLIIIDGVEIFNPYRLYGVISMFNPSTVSDVNLITGAFPAIYGDRLSAVLDVENREGNPGTPLSGLINASIIDANLVLEGRHPFGIEGSWLLSSRRTYYDLILEPFVKNAGLVEDNVSFPNFYDFQAKLTFRLGRGHKIFITGIYSRDGVDVVSSKTRKTADSIAVQNVIRNNVASISWRYASKNKFINRLYLSYYENGGVADFASQVLDPSLNRKSFEEVLPDTLSPYLLGFKFQSDFWFKKTSIEDRFTLNFRDIIFEGGGGIDRMKSILNFNFQLDPSLLAFFSSNPNFRATLNDLNDIRGYNRYKVYLQSSVNISDKLFLQPGVRVDYYDILNKTYAAPRFSFSYKVDDISVIRFGSGVYYQSPGYEKLQDQNILFDLNPQYSEALQAEKAIHYVIGFERWLTAEWNLRFESYYKDFRNLIVQQRIPGSRFYTEKIPGRDSRLANAWTPPVAVYGDSLTQVPVNNSFGEAYGFELLLQKKNSEISSKINGWISYAFAFADRYQDGKIIPFRFDQRHTLNIVGNYKFSEKWDMGIRWQFGSGYPISNPLGVKPRILLADANGDKIPETPVIATRKSFSGTTEEVIFDVVFPENDRYNSRKPAYHRLDVRVTYYSRFWDADWSFYLDVINIYNRSNLIGYNYYVNDDLTLGREANYMFPILPTLGVSIKF